MARAVSPPRTKCREVGARDVWLQLFERFANRDVHAVPTMNRQLVQKSLLDQRVGKRESLAAARRLFDDLSLKRGTREWIEANIDTL
jgi:hypothetical protein